MRSLRVDWSVVGLVVAMGIGAALHAVLFDEPTPLMVTPIELPMRGELIRD
jgi:hypothetical protein